MRNRNEWINAAFDLGSDPKSAPQFVNRHDVTSKLRSAVKDTVIVLVVGPSKTGKTWLVKRFLKERHRALITRQGGDFRSESLWESLLNTKYWNLRPISSALPSIREEVLKKIKDYIENEGKLALFIDDIHFGDLEKTDQFAEDLRYLHDETRDLGLDVYLVGVTSPLTRQIRDAANLDGRLREINCIDWTDAQLVQIITLGCNPQRYGIEFENLELVAANAFRSPFLMVLLTKTIVLNEAPQVRRREIIKHWIDEAQIRRAATRIVDQDFEGIKSLLNKLLSPQAHGALVEKGIERFPLQRGGQASINALFWYIASGAHDAGNLPFDQFKDGVSFTRFCYELDKITTQEIEPLKVYDTLSKMYYYYMEIYNKQGFGKKDPIFELDGDRLYVRDPYFLFVCRNTKLIHD